MIEQKVQAKIIKFLEGRGFIVDKIVIATRAGGQDLHCCDTQGNCWKIEVKSEKGTLTVLQEVKLQKARKNKAMAFAAFGWDDFLTKFNRVYNKETKTYDKP